MSPLHRERRGFTLIELLVVIAIIAILVALLLPAVQQVREAARKSQCQDHLHNLALGMANYEVTFGCYMPGGCDGMKGTSGRLYSWGYFMLPFIEQKPLYDQINVNATPTGAGLADPWTRAAYWTTDIAVFICPSDVEPEDRSQSPSLLSYKACVGDLLNSNLNATRGIFGYRSALKQRDFLDGSSNTLAYAETVIGNNDTTAVLGGVGLGVTTTTPAACISLINSADPTHITGTARIAARLPGGRAWDGRPYYAYFATVVPPNGPTCNSDAASDGGWGHVTASSRHAGGVQAVMGDAKVTFISENIDAGTKTATAPTSTTGGKTPFGVWGALGTRAGGETAKVP